MPASQNLPSLIDTRCDGPFRFVNDACFAVLPTSGTKINSTGSDECAGRFAGSRLATIATAHENAFVRLQLFNLHVDKDVAVRAGVRARLGGKLSSRGRLTWNSGCYATFNSLAPDAAFMELKNATGTTVMAEESCIEMKYDGTWGTADCANTTHQYVVCEKRQGWWSETADSFLTPVPFD